MRPSKSSRPQEPELPHSETAGNPSPTATEADRGKRLHSWKEISAYIGRDPRTAQRWEKFEALPVHRHVHSKAGSVHAFTSEIDAWQRSRLKQAALAEEGTPSPVFVNPRKLPWVLIAAGAGAVLVTVLISLTRSGSPPVMLEPMPLSSLPVEQLSPSFSPDGKSVAFAVGNESGKTFEIYVKPVGGGSERRISPGSALNYSPAWSPDGKTIAFLSGDYGGNAAIELVSPDGTDTRKLRGLKAGVWPWNRGLAWTPDSQALIATDTEKQSDFTSLFRIGLDGAKQRITSPPPHWIDGFPSVSADGKLLVFSRSGAGITRLYEQQLGGSGAAPRQICTQLKDVATTSAVWLGSSGELLVGTERAGAGQLWRIRPFGKPALLTYVPNAIIDVAASSRGDRAVIALRRSDANMWTLPVAADAAAATPTREDGLASTRDEYNGQYSPDGLRIAFESNRSGSPEVWTSGMDGQEARQITHFGGPVTGSPHWSSDGKWIAFDSRVKGHAAIFVVPAQGGDPKRITLDDGPNVVPSWSHNGDWIYFASTRTGRHEVWRIHPDGSDSVQVTHSGGFSAEDTQDGKTIYYTKDRDSVTSLWRIDFNGSNAREVAAPVLDRCFAVAENGVYFASAGTPAAPPLLKLLAFGKGEARIVTRFPHAIMYGLAVSPNGRQLLFAQLDTRAVELMVVNGPFR